MSQDGEKKDINNHVLVLGDWLVDEDWLTSIHRSSSSERTGHIHYRGLYPETTQRSFCGAGKTASIIHQMKNSAICDHKIRVNNSIIGIGVWHQYDEEYLKGLLKRQMDDKPDQMTVKKPPCDKTDEPEDYYKPATVSLVNLARVLKKTKTGFKNPDFGTTRIIRIYQRSGENTELLERIDWERREIKEKWKCFENNEENKKKLYLYLKKELIVALSDKEIKDLSDDESEVESLFSKVKDKIDAVVIKDMLKGVVNNEIVKFLADSFIKKNKSEEVKWYISSKKWLPEWYKLIENNNVRVIFIPNAALKEAVRNENNNLTRWINAQNRATHEALINLRDIRFRFNKKYNKYPLVVALPFEHQVLALANFCKNIDVKNEDDESDRINARTRILLQDRKYITRDQPLLERPFDSILFGAYIVQDLVNADVATNIKKCEYFMLKHSVDYAAHNQRIDIERLIDQPSNTDLIRELGNRIYGLENRINAQDIQTKMLSKDKLNELEVEKQKWIDEKQKLEAKKQVLEVKRNRELDIDICSLMKDLRMIDCGHRSYAHWTASMLLSKVLSSWNESKIEKGIIRENEELFDENLCMGRGECYNNNESISLVKERIELWRGMTEVDGYVCFEKLKRKNLQLLVQELKNFKLGRRKRSRSCMLTASPGSGKSHLVKCLSNTLGYRLLQFNITQMLSTSDLLDSFDRISTDQAQNPDSIFIVFVDEINATLQGQNVYSTFLMPLDEGNYIRAEKVFSIKPCFWIFAGTNDLRKYSEPNGNNTDFTYQKADQKFSDFESRLTLKTINLSNTSVDMDVEHLDHYKPKSKCGTNFDIYSEVINNIKLERIYSSISHSKKIFPDVREISEHVLELFNRFYLNISIRDIGHIIRSFRDVQYGQIKWGNITNSTKIKFFKHEEITKIENSIKKENEKMITVI